MRKIIHLDLDAFFCAVEEREDPSLSGKAFAVGGTERGVIASCSYAARRFGIHSAMPTKVALTKCPNLILISPHHEKYRRASREVMSYLRSVAPVFEQLSIDEAFVDVSDLSIKAKEFATQIQKYINIKFSLPCSIGLASNKLVAKIANDVGKSKCKSNQPPNALTIVKPGDEENFLSMLPIQYLWGIGPKTASRMSRMGIETIGDLAKVPESRLTSAFGKMGRDFKLRAKGIDDRPVTTFHEIKSISNEITFAVDKDKINELKKSLLRLSIKVGSRLEKMNKKASTVKIKVRWYDFRTITRQTTVEVPIQSGEQIYSIAIRLFKQTWDQRTPIRLIGVGVSNFTTQSVQLSLWESSENNKNITSNQKINHLITVVQKRFGKDSLLIGSEYLHKED